MSDDLKTEVLIAALNAKDAGPWTQEQVDKLKAIAAAHEHYVQSLREEAYLAAQRKYDDSIRAAKDELQVQQYGMTLLGEQEVTRNKLIAIRKAELKLAKELADIEKLYKDKTDDESLERRAALEKKARVNAELELQGELGRIQDQFVTQQAQKFDDIFRQGFADMVNNGSDGLKAFGKSLKTTVLTSIADGIYQALIKKWVVNITTNLAGGMEGILGAVGSLMGGGGSNSGTGMLGNIASLGSSIYSMLTGSGGFMGTLLTGIKGLLGIGGGAAASGAYSGAATAVTGMIPSSGGASAGAFSGMSAAWPLAVVAGMFMSNKLYGQGINQFGRQGAGQVLGIGNQIETSILGKIVGDKWANILTGAPVMTYTFNKLFGRTLKDAGIEGTFGGDTGFEGRQFQYYKGGLFRSNKTKYSELDEETRSQFADMFGGVEDGIADMAETIGLSADSLDGFTTKMKLSMMGLTDAEINTKVAEEFKRIADEMAAVVLVSDEYTQGEETRSETLTRLSTRMVAVNQWLDIMGDKLLEVSVIGADMASSLVDQFGSDDAFSSAVQSFVGKYFSQAEQLALVNRQVSDSLGKLGIDTVPQTRDALRDLINAQDLTTEAGRKAYASLMGLADVLDTVYTAAEELANLNLDLDIELLRTQGRETEAVAIERERRIKELLPYGDEVIAKQRKIWEEQDTVLDFTGVNGGVTMPNWTLLGGVWVNGSFLMPTLDSVFFRRSFEVYVTPTTAMTASWSFYYAYDEEA